MTFETRKVIAFETLVDDANLSGKEITSILEELRDDNYAPSHPFEIIVDITKDTQEDYEIHWRKVLNILVEKYQCVYNEKVIVVESL